MLGYWIDEFARHAARLRIRTRVPVPSGTVKLNLGSGFCVASDWINVDGSIHSLLAKAPRPVLSMLYRWGNSLRAAMTEDEYIHRLRNYRFVFAEIRNGLPFADSIADFVYSSHVLEHFVLVDAKQLLRESLRVLKPGGVLRVCVPDLDHVVSLYSVGKAREALQFFYAEEHVGTYHQHRYMYNFELLAQVLTEVGFVDVTKRAYRTGDTPDLDELDNRPQETLYVEARKLA